jgi:hypothetical protein
MERSERSLTGACQCGKLGYEISETPRLVQCCYYTSCQKITASAFSISAVVIEEAFHLTAGQPHVVYRGRMCARWACFILNSREIPTPGSYEARLLAGGASMTRPEKHIAFMS